VAVSWRVSPRARFGVFGMMVICVRARMFVLVLAVLFVKSGSGVSLP